MRLWTLQAPEVVAAVRASGGYRARWDLVTPNWHTAFRAMTVEMTRRGMDCAAAPPVWCWPGRALRAATVRTTANLLLGDHEWAHGRWLLKLAVPEQFTLVTSYGAWNDYLAHTMGFADGPDRMDWTGRPTWARDQLQVTIPELRREWIIRATPYPPDPETAARIAAAPELRVHES
ncbi:hypothetical protein [Nocardia brasiliensis]|uniref:hypothetical protein n=1 Tax=Nocardia brasiliensis TaxID=37326 RepID=UPI001E40DD28|nr:hypothetical protein [Nocardia brasiliensis]